MSGLVDKVKDKVGSGSGPSTGGSSGGSSGGSNGGLKQGSKLPTIGALKENSPTEGSVDLSQLKGKNIIVSVPGAFSPQCSDQVPGYIENADKFAEKGVQGIYVVAVNDSFTVQAWKEKLGGGKAPQLHFLADDEGKFTKGAGMDFDATAFFGNKRSQRYVAIVEDGTVKDVFVEKDPTQITSTAASNVLEKL